MAARREQEAVLRVLRGEPLETVARELQLTAAALSGWRDAFLEAGEVSLTSRPEDDRDVRIAQLQAKLGEVTMDNEQLQEGIELLEAGRPLARRRSRPTPRSRLRGDPGGDEQRAVDLRTPPLRARPRLPGLGRRPGRGLQLADHVPGRGVADGCRRAATSRASRQGRIWRAASGWRCSSGTSGWSGSWSIG